MTIKKKQLKNNKQINDNQLKNNENTINKNQCTMVPWYHNGKKNNGNQYKLHNNKKTNEHQRKSMQS